MFSTFTLKFSIELILSKTKGFAISSITLLDFYISLVHAKSLEFCDIAPIFHVAIVKRPWHKKQMISRRIQMSVHWLPFPHPTFLLGDNSISRKSLADWNFCSRFSCLCPQEDLLLWLFLLPNLLFSLPFSLIAKTFSRWKLFKKRLAQSEALLGYGKT